MRQRLTTLLMLLCLPLAACWERPATPRYITDDQGRALILHGINTSSSAKDPSTGHMPWVTEADVEQETTVFGFNFVRLLVFWDGVEPQKGVYDEAYLDAVQQRVRWYTARGAHVMLDMHQDIYGAAVGGNGAPPWATDTSLMNYLSLDFPGMPWWVKNIDPSVIAAFINFWQHTDKAWIQDHYVAAWVHVAERFRHEPGVIGYDLMNEPHAGDLIRATNGSFESGWLKDLYARLIPALRAVDQDKWLFVEPQSLAVNFGMPSHLPQISDTRAGDKRLVYAPHMYPMTLHEGIPYNLTDRTQMRQWNHNRVQELARQGGVPLLVGEFGGSDSTQGFTDYVDDATALFDTMGASWAYWADDPGSWGLIDGQHREMPKVDHLVRAYPRAIAGEPGSFSYDPKKHRFSVSFTDKAGVTGGTEIFVPRRHFGAGFRVTTNDAVQDWRYEWNPVTQVLTYYPSPSTTVKHQVSIVPAAEAVGGVVLGY